MNRCMSPFESISNVIDWMTSVKGLPISVLQALSLISRGPPVLTAVSSA